MKPIPFKEVKKDHFYVLWLRSETASDSSFLSLVRCIDIIDSFKIWFEDIIPYEERDEHFKFAIRDEDEFEIDPENDESVEAFIPSKMELYKHFLIENI